MTLKEAPEIFHKVLVALLLFFKKKKKIIAYSLKTICR